jgi:hypothetical protein
MKFIKLFVFSTLMLAFTAGGAHKVEAADVFNKVCQEKPNSTVCQDKEGGGNPIFGPAGILTKIVNIVTMLVGIAAVIMIILGGIKLITSGSNPQDVTVAREMILYAIVAVVIASLAQAIVRLFLNKVF